MNPQGGNQSSILPERRIQLGSSQPITQMQSPRDYFLLKQMFMAQSPTQKLQNIPQESKIKSLQSYHQSNSGELQLHSPSSAQTQFQKANSFSRSKRLLTKGDTQSVGQQDTIEESETHTLSSGQPFQKQKPNKIAPIDDRPSTVLQIDLKSDLNQVYKSKEYVRLFQDVCVNQQNFQEFIKEQSSIGCLNLYESTQSMMNEHKSFFFLVFRLRKLFQATIEMTQKADLNDALTNVINQACIVLESDRASVFVYD